jgi:hypothetical protein
MGSIHGTRVLLAHTTREEQCCSLCTLASVSCALQKRNAHIIAISAQRVLSLARGIAVAVT